MSDSIKVLGLSSLAPIAFCGLIGLVASILINACRQTLFHAKSEPPAVFHWIPYIGNAVSYGMDPVGFFVKYRAKYGDVFTFTLFGRKMTCYLGIEGNDFILNGKLQDINAEEIYGPLTIPVFGKDVIYDCPNSKLMEQKKFVKFGLTQKALESHVPLIEKEVVDYIKMSPAWKGSSGVVDISAAMSEITLFTAARSLQGEEVRQKLTAEFAGLYHDLDMGFTPVNFLFPWLPLPRNRRRDAAHNKMRDVYEDIIIQRRKNGLESDDEYDMLWNLMNSNYKDGTPVPDKEVACMMITLLMGGQHSSSSASAWIMHRLAAHPDVAEELYQEQILNLGHGDESRLSPMQYCDLDKLPLLHNVVKETLRLHGSIHSILRKVMNPLAIPGSPYVVGTDKVLLASPMVTAISDEYFPDAKSWNPHRWDELQPSESIVDANDVVDYGYGAVSKGTRSPYIPFGAGRHRCIGEKFAYLNLGVIVGTIVRNFKLGTIDGSTGIVPPTDHTSMFARPVQPGLIRWTRRE
ncbi:14-alpha sterol demethylase Cyp51A [Colletotrichum paranaense]|uniref:14-alpha sterol demethylase Cyp51A n=1 Tax=Colletotrichum paranaense TaxID=1914294 RepID=A0ABQ9SZI8_9PEZI|nr:14-alpha sterol demethylase Cyp51A [Colletotrichum paranaense]KAK1544935.1 14-alpha sterol demethylase Cyp51A [Colletotrichum paranaense]